MKKHKLKLESLKDKNFSKETFLNVSGGVNTFNTCARSVTYEYTYGPKEDFIKVVYDCE